MSLNFLLLNPPNKNNIQRRYMCSYNAPNMLFPPFELIALGGILNELNIYHILVDAIAEKLDISSIDKIIINNKINYLISIIGFECFEEDINVLNKIKTNHPNLNIYIFGHYATLFYEEILSKSKVDLVIIGEPDLILKNIAENILEKSSLNYVSGIAYKDNNGDIQVKTGNLRINNPDSLPFPAYQLLKRNKYFEPFLDNPFGLIQTARGCPYTCNYCVRSYGKKLTYRTTQQIIEEIKYLKHNHNIKSIRFIDDTFTANKKRVIEICNHLISENLKIKWTCLSRLDTIDIDMIKLMSKAGCKRIYFGVESGSNKILEDLNKKVDLDKSINIINSCRINNIETLGFFIVGTPNENDSDFSDSIDFAVKANFDFIAVSSLILYPGTELYEKNKHLIDFNLFPYKNEWKNENLKKISIEREKVFYRKFYFRFGYYRIALIRFIKNPIETFYNIVKLYYFVYNKKFNKRKDYL